MKDNWHDILMQGVLRSLHAWAEGEATSLQAFELARDIGQAQLAGIVLPARAQMNEKCLRLSLESIKRLCLKAAARCDELARRWEYKPGYGNETVDALTAESESLMQSVHELHCAWWSVCESCWASPQSMQETLSEEHRLCTATLDLLKIRLEQRDAQSLLAAAWDYLGELRERFPSDSEARLWWYLAENGSAAKAFELETTEWRQGVPGPASLQREPTAQARGQVILLAPWRCARARAVAAGTEAEESASPSAAMKSWFEKIPQPDLNEVRREIEGEGTYYISRRLNDEWKILVDIDREDEQDPAIVGVLFGQTQMTRVLPTRWVLDIELPRNVERVRQLAFASMTIVFFSGRIARLDVCEQ